MGSKEGFPKSKGIKDMCPQTPIGIAHYKIQNYSPTLILSHWEENRKKVVPNTPVGNQNSPAPVVCVSKWDSLVSQPDKNMRYKVFEQPTTQNNKSKETSPSHHFILKHEWKILSAIFRTNIGLFCSVPWESLPTPFQDKPPASLCCP